MDMTAIFPKLFLWITAPWNPGDKHPVAVFLHVYALFLTCIFFEAVSFLVIYFLFV